MGRDDDKQIDNLDRGYFGQPGCMLILLLLVAGYIIYNIFFK